jgi:hypothetical protein
MGREYTSFGRNPDLPAAYEGKADITRTLAKVAIYEYVKYEDAE